MHDLPGKFIGLLLAFVLLVLVPLVNTSLEEELMDRRAIVMDVTNFIDEVVDSRQITSLELKDFNSKLASYNVTVEYEITRYVRSVNPSTEGGYYTNYLPSKDFEKFETGDRISVHVKTVGYSGVQQLTHNLTGMYISDLDKTFTARIR